MLHAGLDLSRKRLDVCLIGEGGELVGELAVAPDADGLRGLARRLAGQRVRAVEFPRFGGHGVIRRAHSGLVQ
jgi:hypothetical protein